MTEGFREPNLTHNPNLTNLACKITGTLVPKSASVEDVFLDFSEEKDEYNSNSEEFLGFPVIPKKEKLDLVNADKQFPCVNIRENSDSIVPHFHSTYLQKSNPTILNTKRHQFSNYCNQNISKQYPLIKKKNHTWSSNKTTSKNANVLDPPQNSPTPMDEANKMAKLRKSRSLGDLSLNIESPLSPIKNEPDPRTDCMVNGSLDVVNTLEKNPSNFQKLQDKVKRVLQNTMLTDPSIKNINMKIEVITATVTRQEVLSETLSIRDIQDGINRGTTGTADSELPKICIATEQKQALVGLLQPDDQNKTPNNIISEQKIEIADADQNLELEIPEVRGNGQQKTEPEEDNLSTISSLVALSCSTENSANHSPRSAFSSTSHLDNLINVEPNDITDINLVDSPKSNTSHIVTHKDDIINHSIENIEPEQCSENNKIVLDNNLDGDSSQEEVLNKSPVISIMLLKTPKISEVDGKNLIKSSKKKSLKFKVNKKPNHKRALKRLKKTKPSTPKRRSLRNQTKSDLEASVLDSAGQKISKNNQIKLKIKSKSIGEILEKAQESEIERKPKNISLKSSIVSKEIESSQKRESLSRICKEQSFIREKAPATGDTISVKTSTNTAAKSEKLKTVKPCLSVLPQETPRRTLPSRKCKENEKSSDITNDNSTNKVPDQNLSKQLTKKVLKRDVVESENLNHFDVVFSNLDKLRDELGVIRELNVILNPLMINQHEESSSDKEEKSPQQIELESKMELFKCLKLQSIPQGRHNDELLSKTCITYVEQRNHVEENYKTDLKKKNKEATQKSNIFKDTEGNKYVCSGKTPKCHISNNQELKMTICSLSKQSKCAEKEIKVNVESNKKDNSKIITCSTLKQSKCAEEEIELNVESNKTTKRRKTLSASTDVNSPPGKPLSRSKSLACLSNLHDMLDFNFKDLANSMLDVFAPMRITRSKVPQEHEKGTDNMNSVLEGRKSNFIKRPVTSMSGRIDLQDTSDQESCTEWHSRKRSKSVPRRQYFKNIRDSEDYSFNKRHSLMTPQTKINYKNQFRNLKDNFITDNENLDRNREIKCQSILKRKDKSLNFNKTLENKIELPSTMSHKKSRSPSKKKSGKSFFKPIEDADQDISTDDEPTDYERTTRSKSVMKSRLHSSFKYSEKANTIESDNGRTMESKNEIYYKRKENNINKYLAEKNQTNKSRELFLNSVTGLKKELENDSENQSDDEIVEISRNMKNSMSESPEDRKQHKRFTRGRSVSRRSLFEIDSPLKTPKSQESKGTPKSQGLSERPSRSKSVSGKDISQKSSSEKIKNLNLGKLIRNKSVEKKIVTADSDNSSIDLPVLTPRLRSKSTPRNSLVPPLVIKTQSNAEQNGSSASSNFVPQKPHSPERVRKTGPVKLLRSKSLARNVVTKDSDTTFRDSTVLTPRLRGKSIPRNYLPSHLINNIQSHESPASNDMERPEAPPLSRIHEKDINQKGFFEKIKEPQLANFLKSKSVPRKVVTNDPDSSERNSPVLTPRLRSKSIPRNSLPLSLVSNIESHAEQSNSPATSDWKNLEAPSLRRSKSVLELPLINLEENPFEEESNKVVNKKKRARSIGRPPNESKVNDDKPELEEVNLDECSYKLGNFVWAQVCKFPYWPAMVCDDPELKTFVKKAGKVQYHVRFFNDNGKRAWIPEGNLMEYCTRSDITEMVEKFKNLKIKTKYLKPRTQGILRKWEDAIEELEKLREKGSNEVYGHLVESFVKHYNETHVSRSISVEDITSPRSNKPPRKKLKRETNKKDTKKDVETTVKKIELTENKSSPIKEIKFESEGINTSLSPKKSSLTKPRKFPPIKIKIKFKKTGHRTEFSSSSADDSFVDFDSHKKRKTRKKDKSKRRRRHEKENATSDSQDDTLKIKEINEITQEHLVTESKNQSVNITGNKDKFKNESTENSIVTTIKGCSTSESFQIKDKTAKSLSLESPPKLKKINLFTKPKNVLEKPPKLRQRCSLPARLEKPEDLLSEKPKINEVITAENVLDTQKKDDDFVFLKPSDNDLDVNLQLKKKKSLLESSGSSEENLSKSPKKKSVKKREIFEEDANKNQLDSPMKKKKSPRDDSSDREIKISSSTESPNKKRKGQKDDSSDSESKISAARNELRKLYSYENQVELHRKHNPFNGKTKIRVCNYCLQPGDLHKCKGKCGGIFHVECASKVMLPKPHLNTSKQIKKPRKSAGTSTPVIGTPTRGVRNSDSDSRCSSSNSSCQIVDVASKRLANISNPNVPCLPPTFNQLTLNEQIDYRMKEVMSRFDEQITYADSSTDTSSEEGSDISLTGRKNIKTSSERGNPNENQITEAVKVAVMNNSSSDNTPTAAVPSIANKLKEALVKHVTADSVVIDDGTDPTNFRCEFCRLEKYPPCNACGLEVTSIGVSELHQCSYNHCNKTFHKPCLRIWPQAQWSIGKWTRDQTSQDMFTCPSHVCHTCFSEELGTGSVRLPGDKLARCLLCPAAYHASTFCIPAGCEVLGGSQLICPRHRKTTQPLNTSWCFICSEGGNLVCCDMCPTSVHPECQPVIYTDDDKYICEDCESGRFPLYDEVVWVKLGSYRWWPALVLFPNEVPENMLSLKHQIGDFAVRFFGTNDHYWVSKSRSFLFQEGDRGGGPEESISSKKKVYELFERAIEDAAVAFELKKDFKLRREAESITSLKPPPFIRTVKNKPIGNVKLEFNMSNTTACDCDPSGPRPCGIESDCINRLLMTECDPELCSAGTKCRNQSFEKREYPPMVPYKTQGRGWGLKTLASVKKGQFVIEYVGDLIDQEEYQRRIEKMHETKEENYYFMTLDNDRMIDAGPKGNLSRFMNHSCNPNCETQKWTVRGDTRVGLFALKDIAANSELTFNYNLECVGREKKTCKCGAANCSGFIGAKAKPEQDSDSGSKPTSIAKTRKKKKMAFTPLPPCFKCGRKAARVACIHKNCNKHYHLRCLELTEKPDRTKYVCPRHNCNLCSNRTIRCCVKCVNSFCPSHSAGNIRHDNQLGFVCRLHDRRKGISDGLESNIENGTVDSKKALLRRVEKQLEDYKNSPNKSRSLYLKLYRERKKLMTLVEPRKSSLSTSISSESDPSTSNEKLIRSLEIQHENTKKYRRGKKAYLRVTQRLRKARIKELNKSKSNNLDSPDRLDTLTNDSTILNKNSPENPNKHSKVSESSEKISTGSTTSKNLNEANNSIRLGPIDSSTQLFSELEKTINGSTTSEVDKNLLEIMNSFKPTRPGSTTSEDDKNLFERINSLKSRKRKNPNKNEPAAKRRKLYTNLKGKRFKFIKAKRKSTEKRVLRSCLNANTDNRNKSTFDASHNLIRNFEQEKLFTVSDHKTVDISKDTKETSPNDFDTNISEKHIKNDMKSNNCSEKRRENTLDLASSSNKPDDTFIDSSLYLETNIVETLATNQKDEIIANELKQNHQIGITKDLYLNIEKCDTLKTLPFSDVMHEEKNVPENGFVNASDSETVSNVGSLPEESIDIEIEVVPVTFNFDEDLDAESHSSTDSKSEESSANENKDPKERVENSNSVDEHKSSADTIENSSISGEKTTKDILASSNVNIDSGLTESEGS